MAMQSQLQNVVQNLKSDTAFKGQYSSPKNLNDRMAELHTPAVSIAVIDDYQIAAVESYGTYESGGSRPITEDTLFLAGSISKSVFATAIMCQVQAGKLDLDEDINHYLQTWKIPANQGWQPRITLRHLLSHTSGLTVHGFPGYQSTENIPSVCQILNGEWPANTEKVEVNILPGMQFRYSGGGTTVAQLAVTDYFNDHFPALMNQWVLQPLGMHHSTFENPLPSSSVPMAAIAHPFRNIPVAGGHHVYPESAAAGLWTTAKDLAIFGLALQNALRGEQTSFLQRRTIEQMLGPQLVHEQDNSDFAGLGFFCEGNDKHAVFSHGGWDEGFVAEMTLYRQSGKGAVIMINSNEGHPLISEISRAIAEEFGWPEAPDTQTVVQLSDLTAYVGQYKSEHSHDFTIEQAENGLLLQFDSQAPVLFEPSSKLKFFSRMINTEIEFECDDTGAITALTGQQSGAQLKALKLQGSSGG